MSFDVYFAYLFSFAVCLLVLSIDLCFGFVLTLLAALVLFIIFVFVVLWVRVALFGVPCIGVTFVTLI